MKDKSDFEQQIKKEADLCPLYNFIVKEEYIYCFCWKYNLLLKFCIATGAMEYRKVIDNYLPNAYMLYHLISVEDKIIALPYVANHVIIWDQHSMDMMELELPIKHLVDGDTRKFSTYAYIQQENKIILFPGDTGYVCELDLVKNNVTGILNIRKYLLEKYDFGYSFFTNGSYLKGNDVYLGSFETNRIIKYNIATKESELITIDEADGEVRGVCGYENIIFVLLNNGKMIMRNIDTLKTTVITICEEKDVTYWSTGEERLACYGGYVFAFPERIEFSKKIRVSDGKVMPVFTPKNIGEMQKKSESYDLFFGCFDRGTIYIYSHGGDVFYFNADTMDEIGHIHLQYEVDELLQWIKPDQLNPDDKRIIREDKYIYNIHDLVNSTVKEKKTSERSLESVSVGDKIYHEVNSI